ncbi:MAG TPA: EamA family transporter [Burkholderiales bacterium]|nr:EamA family transporter [Burkholderiales bacterium]
MEIPVPVALAVLGAALLHAGWNAFLKSGTDKQLDAIGIAVGSGAVALAAAPFMGVPAPVSWPWLAASALVHIAYFWLLAGAYRWGDLSFSYPIMRGGGPLIVTVAGVMVLGEVLPWAETLGVLLISAGILAFAAHTARDAVAQRKSLWFALGNAVVIAGYTLIDAKGARLSGAPVAYALWFFVANGAVMLALGYALRGAAVPRHVLRRWRLTFGGGAGAVLAYGTALWAMTLAPVALVAVLRETSVVFAAALGALFLKEPFTARRAGATLVVLAGLVALRV